MCFTVYLSIWYNVHMAYHLNYLVNYLISHSLHVFHGHNVVWLGFELWSSVPGKLFWMPFSCRVMSIFVTQKIYFRIKFVFHNMIFLVDVFDLNQAWLSYEEYYWTLIRMLSILYICVSHWHNQLQQFENLLMGVRILTLQHTEVLFSFTYIYGEDNP